jgi:hypothetical protein
MYWHRCNLFFSDVIDVQRWPADAEFLNKEIEHFGWMQILFGPCPEGPPRTTCYANDVKRAISKKVVRRPKFKSGGSSKAVADEKSDDDFMPPSRARGKAKFNSGGASKNVADENSDDDFMPPSGARGRAK